MLTVCYYTPHLNITRTIGGITTKKEWEHIKKEAEKEKADITIMRGSIALLR